MTIITKASLAAELGVTKARISQYAEAGMPIRADGKLDRDVVLNWIGANYVSSNGKDIGAGRASRLARERRRRPSARHGGGAAPPTPKPDAAERLVVSDGQAPYEYEEAIRIKENYMALLRQLEYEDRSSKVVAVDDAAAALASECAIIRSTLRTLGANVASRVAVLRDPSECQREIDAETDRILEYLTQRS